MAMGRVQVVGENSTEEVIEALFPSVLESLPFRLVR
jgi:hypothetical protein